MTHYANAPEPRHEKSKNIGVDRAADQCLRFHYIDGTIHLLPNV